MAPMSRRPQADDARRLSVQQTASRVLLEQASLDEAMAEILRVVATALDWSLAVYWVLVPGAPGGQYWWIFKREAELIEVIAMWTRGGAAMWEHVFRSSESAAWLEGRLTSEIDRLELRPES